jgi:hypothetical protein
MGHSVQQAGCLAHFVTSSSNNTRYTAIFRKIVTRNLRDLNREQRNWSPRFSEIGARS